MEEQLKLATEKILDLGNLSLDFAKINRATRHQDGIRSESDTDHTFMLSLIACSFVDSFYKDKLDIGLVCQFCIAHDVVEVYAGDTDTLTNNSEAAKKLKEERELESLNKIREKFGKEFPWIHEIIERYEAQDTKEARFVKFLDKILPKITIVLNNAKELKNRNSKEDYENFLNEQLSSYKKYSDEFPELFVLFNNINKKTLELF